MDYYVYRLDIDDKAYIGCTNNIRRRTHQHNENARKRKSKLGRYLNDKGRFLTEKDFLILFHSDNRKEALEKERSIAKKIEHDGTELLNDNYSVNCSRKGKNLGKTCKRYVLVDYVLHTAIHIENLRQYCVSAGLDYKLIQRTTSNATSGERYIAFRENEWEAEPNKADYLSGKALRDKKLQATERRVMKQQKTYDVSFPDGHMETVVNLDRFAREHGLTSGTLHATIINNKPTKGYQAFRRV